MLNREINEAPIYDVVRKLVKFHVERE